MFIMIILYTNQRWGSGFPMLIKGIISRDVQCALFQEEKWSDLYYNMVYMYLCGWLCVGVQYICLTFKTFKNAIETTQMIYNNFSL